MAKISVEDRSSYDYWALRQNGDFYFLGSLFEDTQDPTRIFSTQGLFVSQKRFSTAHGCTPNSASTLPR